MMARAVVFHGPARPLELVRFSMPKVRNEEVLVRVNCTTLCRSDLHTHAGRRTESTPALLGHEIVGRIVEFGSSAACVDASGQAATVGDRISWTVAVGCGHCFFCTEDLPQKCERPYKYGHERVSLELPVGGGLAEYVVLVPGTCWFRVPEELSDRVAAPANCATATVAALFRHAGSVTGRSVLVLGAGVLGATACAMAHASGARLILASDPVPASRERVLIFGATHSFSSEVEELARCVAEVTKGRGADVVLDLSGMAQSVQAGLRLTRTGGTLILAGTVAPTTPVAIEPEQVVRRMLTIRGVHNYHPRDLQTALAFLAGPGRSFPFESLIAAEYPLEDVEQAFAFAHSHPGVRVAVRP
jgi:alcohol dehydrogenase